jgi:ketosteroid isomerase-like protein
VVDIEKDDQKESIMRWTRLVVFSLCLGWAGACSNSQPSVDIRKDKAAIDKTREAYASAWRSSDAAKVTGLYADDALVLHPNRPPIAGRAAIQSYFSQFFGDFDTEFELTSAEIEVAGSWAFDRGTYRWKSTPKAGGPPLRITGSTS